MKLMREWWRRNLTPFVERRFGKILEINRRYAKPQIKMTPTVQAVLLFLRLYLILLVGILVYKFIISLGTGFV
jgi:hypothetical protein